MQKNPNSLRRAQKNAGHKPSEVWAVLAAVGILAVGVTAFFIINSRKKELAPLHLLVGVDTSGSVAPGGRKQLFGIFDEVVDTVLPKQTNISFWTFDVNAHKIAEKESNKSTELWPLEDEIVATHTKEQGTYPSVVLEKMLESAKVENTKGKSCACMLMTDGEDFDKPNSTKCITELAALPNVKAIWIEGAMTSNGFRSDVEKRWRPILKDKLVVSSDHDAEDGMHKFSNLIERP